MSSLSSIIDRLTQLTLDLADDVRVASTRVEHVRTTTRANELNNILTDLMTLDLEQTKSAEEK